MFDPELNYAKADVLRLVAGHIFGRNSSSPRVLDAALAFVKRRHPQLWNTEEGRGFIAALRATEETAEYGNTESVQKALADLAASNGLADMGLSFDHMGFKQAS